MSSFGVDGSGTVTFSEDMRPFEFAGEAPWRTMRIGVLVTTAAAWETLVALRSRVARSPIPSGTGQYDVLNGPGLGTLVVSNLGTASAYLTDLSGPRLVLGVQRYGVATFDVTVWTPA